MPAADTLHNQLATLKRNQKEQLAKLSYRADSDVELLDLLRSFMKEKAEIDATYAKALEKLGRTYILKKFKKGPALPKEVKKTIQDRKKDTSLSKKMDDNEMTLEYTMADDSPVRAMYNTYLAVVQDAERLGKARSAIAEKIVSQITDAMKDLSREKMTSLKKNIDFGTSQILKVQYDKLAKETETAQRKYNELSAKPNKGLNAFKSMVTGKDADERVEKLRVKWKDASQRLTAARNDYLLAMESVNAQQAMYYSGDLPALMKKLDGTFYSSLVKHLDTYIDFETNYSATLNDEMAVLKESAALVNENDDFQSFLKENSSIFQDPSGFSFDPTAGDDCDTVIVDDVTKIMLGQRLARLHTQEEELRAQMEKKSKELSAVTVLADAYRETPAFGNSANPLDQKIDIENSLDLMQCIQGRLLAQIKLLENSGVEPVKPTGASAPSGSSTMGRDSVSIPRSSTDVFRKPTSAASSSAATYLAQYEYDAKEDGEVSMAEGDEVVGLEPENAGWIKVCVQRTGKEGMVPFDYLKAKTMSVRSVSTSSIASLPKPRPVSRQVTSVIAVYDYTATDSSELSFKAGDTIDITEAGEATEDAWWEGRNSRTGKQGTFPVVFTQGWDGKVSVSAPASPKTDKRTSAASSMASVATLAVAGRSGSRISMLGGGLRPTAAHKDKARAIYQYTASCDGELSLEIGDEIVVTNKDTGSAAWWEGESSRGKGQFPVNHVEPMEEEPRPVSTVRTSVASQPMPRKSETGFSVKAVYDFKGETAGELTFKAGDFIKVVDATDKDWWKGVFRGKEGLLPSSYVEKV
ncbi:hypothetical protein HK101_011141 [Irineochytrium annulatum]|nr:hypothetical protein HK101_011141 [Irineochytrium annulatum]